MKTTPELSSQAGAGGLGYILLWAIGLPLPLVILLFFLWH